MRHVEVGIERPGASIGPEDDLAPDAPAWFVRLIAQPPKVTRFPIVFAGAPIGNVVLIASPRDEITESWTNWRDEMVVLGLVSGAVISVVLVALGLALRPLTQLSEALGALEGGDFAVRAPPSSDPQIQRLADRFNGLAASLELVSADNRMLMDKLMSVQDAERREIASELHDEIGPSLFGIRADIGAISRLTRKPNPDTGVIRERLTSISEMITQIQRINARLLEQLRPIILDQLPLCQAVEKSLEGWRDRYPGITWTGRIQPGLDLSDERNQALFRSVQEALTNVVRHAKARRVEVVLASADGRVSLTVNDDGVGLVEGGRKGIGLLGMQERARTLGGRLTLGQSALGGAAINLEIPEADEVA